VKQAEFSTPSGVARVEEESTYGLKPKGLARLLSVGAEGLPPTTNPSVDRMIAELLQDILSRELPLVFKIPDSLPPILCQSYQEVLAVAGHALRDLLLSPETNLTLIAVIKNYAKELVRDSDSQTKTAAAIAVYYAAIANALLFREQKITQFSYQELGEAYAELEEKPWVPTELKELYRKALDASRRRAKETT
jgi:hypothetical protein